MARPSKKDIRQERGLSTAQVAAKAGVSQRTVQRYERGESKNEKLSKVYNQMATANRQARYRERQTGIVASGLGKDIRSMTDQELKAAVKREGRMARSRYENIKKREKEYSYASDAIRKYENKVGHGAGRTAGKSRAQLQQQLASIREFTGLKTSTVRGQELAHENRRKASEKTSGLSGVYNDVFWELYNRIKENPEMYGYSITDFYPSENQDTRQNIRNEIAMGMENIDASFGIDVIVDEILYNLKR